MPDAVSRTTDESRSTVVRLMLPSDANFMGNVFGGVILAEVDRVAYVTATRHARMNCVTASFDRVDFLEPVRVGELVEFEGHVSYVGRTSMEVSVAAQAVELREGAWRKVSHAFVTMVAFGEDGRPAQVPQLELRTDGERKEFKLGEKRMAHRRRTRTHGTPESDRTIQREAP